MEQAIFGEVHKAFSLFGPCSKVDQLMDEQKNKKHGKVCVLFLHVERQIYAVVLFAFVSPGSSMFVHLLLCALWCGHFAVICRNRYQIAPIILLLA